MRQFADLAIFLFVVFIVQELTDSKRTEGCKKAKIFRKRSYSYDYIGSVENGIKGTSENAAKIVTTANVLIKHVHSCDYVMQLNNVKVTESFGDGKGYSVSAKSAAAAEALQEFPLQFTINNGIITEIRPALKERQKEILNIKRGILSSFQVRWSKKRTVYETDVSGLCEVTYKLTKNEDGTKKVTKIKDLAGCQDRTMAHSNIETTQYEEMSSIYEAKSSCDFAMGKKNEIQTVVCNELYLMKPFSTGVGAGSYTSVSQSLSLRRVKKIKGARQQYPETYATTLKFDHKHEEQMKSSDDSAAAKLLNELIRDANDKTLPSTASRFAELVFSLRLINEQGFGKLLRRFESCFAAKICDPQKSVTFWSYFFEAIAQCGTTSCVNILGGMIMQRKIPADKIDDLISALNFVQEPSPAMLNTVMGIYKATSNPTAVLLLGTLMHKLCKHRPSECRGRGPIGSVIGNAEFFLIRLLGNDCRVTDPAKIETMYYALKAIGNAGRPVRMQDVILDCVRHATEMKISIAALQALRRMPKGDNIANLLRVILSDTNVDSEKRMEAFLVLMKRPFEGDILLAIDMVNDNSEAYQLRSFIRSYLIGVSRSRGPHKKSFVDLFRNTLAKRNMTDFNPTATRFSKVFDKSLFVDYAEVGAGVNGHVIFHPESFVPRTVQFGLDTQVLGHAVNLIEINARMEGFERIVGRFFGKNGYLSKQFLTGMFDIPDDIPDKEDGDRKRRSIDQRMIWNRLRDFDDKVNMKEILTPKADVSIRVFGNEIRLLKRLDVPLLKDIPVVDGDVDDFNIVKALYSLTKGRSMTLRRSLLFLEGSYVVPTILGLPLSFQMNGSAVVSLNLEGKIKAKNLLVGPKIVTLKGAIQPSASLDVSGKVTVDGWFSRAGLRVHSRTHASTILGGEINYKEGQEFHVNVDVPEDHIDLFNYTHEMFHVVGSQESEISGSKRRTSLNVCADELFNSTALLGVDVCTDMSFPVAYHNLKAPYYPLTGPANIGFRLKKTDPSLKHYHLSVVKSNDLYKVEFGTPNADNPRLNKMNLGITPGGQKGVVGATFGNTNRGLLLRYEYDNKTHGLTANIYSNITQDEISITTKYFNNTDPTTLDLKMGLEFDLISYFISVSNQLYFVDTYEYWGFNWLLDYGKAPINAELKVAYNPQTVFVKWMYGERNFAIKLVPSFPVISFDTQIQWQPVVMNVTAKLDIKNATVKIIANTTSTSYGGYAGWVKKRGEQQILVKLNSGKDFYRWITALEYKKPEKRIKSHVTIKQKEYGVTFKFSKRQIYAGIQGYPAQILASLLQDQDTRGIQVRGNAGQNRMHLQTYYQRDMISGLRALCAEAGMNERSGGLCLNLVQRGDKRSMEIKVTTTNGTYSTSFIHRSPKDMPDVFKLRTRYDGRKMFEGNITTGNNRGSLFNIAVPPAKFSLHFMMPTSNIERGVFNMSSLFGLRFINKEGEHKFDLNSKFLLHLNNSRYDSVWSVKSTLKGNNSHVIWYEEVNGRDPWRATSYSGLESIYSDNHLTQQIKRYSFLGTQQMTGYTIFKRKDIPLRLNNKDLLSGVQNELEKIKPQVNVSVDLRTSPRTIETYFLYPKTVLVEIFGNKVLYNINLEKQVANMNMVLPMLTIDFNVKFHQPDKYDISIKYENGSGVAKEATITISKSDEKGLWEVLVHHPPLKGLFAMLKKKYDDDFSKMKGLFFSKVKNAARNMTLSEDLKERVLTNLFEVLGRDYLNTNLTNAVSDSSKAWKGLMNGIFDERFQLMMNQLFEVTKGTGNQGGKFKERLKVLAGELSKLVGESVSLETLQRLLKGGEVWKESSAELIRLAEKPAVRQIVLNGIKKSLAMQNVSKRTQDGVMILINRWYSDVLSKPSTIVPLYINISRAIMKERNIMTHQILSREISRLMGSLRSKLPQSMSPELKSELERLMNEAHKLFNDMRPGKSSEKDDTVFLQMLKSSHVSQSKIHNMALQMISYQLLKVGFPISISKAIAKFTKAYDYPALYYGVMEYVARYLNLTKTYPDLVTKIYNADVKSVLLIASVAANDDRMPMKVRSVFADYLRDLNINRLLRGLFWAALPKTEASDDIKSLLDKTINDRNLTEFARRASLYALTKVIMPEDAKNILRQIVSGPANGNFIHTLLKYASKSANLTNNWDDIINSVFPSSVNAAEFSRLVFKEIIKEVKSVPEIQKILHQFAASQNVSKIINDMAALGEAYVAITANVSRQKDTFKFAKNAVLKYFNKVIDFVPDPWRARVFPIINEISNGVKQTKEEELARNATKVLFTIGKDVYKVAEEYIIKYLAADVERDAKNAIEGLMSKMTFGNVPVSQLVNQTTSMLKERFGFGLRLLAQLFPKQVRKFQKRYLRKDFNFDKLYKDILKANLSSNENKMLVENMVGDFGSRVLMEITNATGGFSTATGFLNMLKFVKGLNFTNLNSVVRSYEKMKNMKYSNWSVPVLLHHLKGVLKTVGRMYIANRTINEHLAPMIRDFRTVLPKIIGFSENLERRTDLIFRNTTMYLKTATAMFKKSVAKYSTAVGFGFQNWRKVLTFMSDLVVPVLGTTKKLARSAIMENRTRQDYARIHQYLELLSRYDRYNVTTDILVFLEKTNGLPVEKALQMILRKGAGVFEDLTGFVAKKLQFITEEMTGIQKEIQALLRTINKFLRSKAGQPLHKLIHKSGKHSINYLRSAIGNSTLIQRIKNELAPIYKLRNSEADIQATWKGISENSNRIFESLNQNSIQSWAREAVPALINNATMGMTKGMIDIMTLIDTARVFALSNKFLKDPKAYLRNMPREIMGMLGRSLSESEAKIFAWFLEAERATKAKMLEGKRIYMKSLQEVQYIIWKIRSKLDKINHYSEAINLIKDHGFARYINKYTSKLDLELAKMKAMISNYTGEKNASKSLESLLGGLTKDTARKGDSFMRGAFANMTKGARDLVTKMEKAKGERSKYEELLEKNLTGMVIKAELSTKAFFEKIAGKLRNSKMGSTDWTINKELFKVTRKIQSELQRVKSDLKQFIQIRDDSSILFIVPEIPKLKELLRLPLGDSGKERKRDKDQPVLSSRRIDASFISGGSTSYDTASSSKQRYARPGDKDILLKQGRVYSQQSTPQEQTSSSSKRQFDGQIIVNVTTVSTNAVAMSSSQKPDTSSFSGLQKANQLLRTIPKHYVDGSFKILQARIDSVPGFFTNGTRTYHYLIDKMDEQFESLAHNVYNKRFVEPLKKLSVAATIPPPAETLQSMFRTTDVLTQASRLFMPLPGSATLYGNHIFTYDGKYVFIPNSRRSRQCSYLLTRDFGHGAFTFLYSNQNIKMIVGESTIMLSRSGRIEMTAMKNRRFLFKTTELPAAIPAPIGLTIVKSFGSTVKISNVVYGLVIHCNTDLFMCNFTVSGMFHNKTLGLFGTNNMEYVDDLRLPDGGLALDLVEFVKGWEITGHEKCKALKRRDFLPACRIADNPKCALHFRNRTSVLARAFTTVNPLPYFLACRYETTKCPTKDRPKPPSHCPTVGAFVRKCLQYGIKVEYPQECVSCMDTNGGSIPPKSVKFLKDPSSVDIILIVRDSKAAKKALKNLKEVMNRLDSHLKAMLFDPKYSVVGFDGFIHRQQPFIQTGNGHASGTIVDLQAALDNLEFKNTIRTINGLSAIQFAAGLNLRPVSTKMFIILDTVAVYTGALKEMIETNALLSSKGIILNAINKYKFKRNIIAKDSFNTRYHLKIPRGERLRNLAFRTADDYIPIIKESGGGIMTIKALISSNEKWMKAFPVSFNHIILKQIRNDKRRCKSCRCGRHREGHGVLQCSSSMTTKC